MYGHLSESGEQRFLDKNDNGPIGRLMHDFRCVSAVDMFYPELAAKVRELKETKEEVRTYKLFLYPKLFYQTPKLW